MRGYTKKPCHGCGEVPSHYYGRPTEGVCESCRELLKLAKYQQAHLEKSSDAVLYALPWTYYELPHLYRVSTWSDHEPPDPGYVFQRTIFDLIHHLAMIKNKDRRMAREQPVIDGTKSHQGEGYLDPTVRDGINTIYQSVLKMLEEAFDKGKKDGQSLMLGLARGEVSIDNFNKAAVKIG